MYVPKYVKNFGQWTCEKEFKIGVHPTRKKEKARKYNITISK
jgi:hypothetical protein